MEIYFISHSTVRHLANIETLVFRKLGGVRQQEVFYTFVNYEDELSAIESAISELADEQSETQQEMTQQADELRQAIIDGMGVQTALFGMIIGFFAIVELLKVWLE